MAFHVFLSHIWSSGQDQVAIIKRKLQLMLNSCEIFLDVDNLDDISQLEYQLTSSQCFLIFLSSGYFFSPSCLREFDCALKHHKPFILVHEKDEAKGGASLAALRADCESKGRDAGPVFDEGPGIITWHRANAFQLVSLKLIAEQMLAFTPVYEKQSTRQPKLYVRGELDARTLELRQKVRLYASNNNPGARVVATEFAARLKHGKELLTIATELPESLQKLLPSAAGASPRRAGSSTPKRRGSSAALIRRASSEALKRASGVVPVAAQLAHTATDQNMNSTSHPDGQITHMMLYLNDKTFVGELGQVLVEEVTLAHDNGIEVVLAHEADPDCGGCPFGRFFEITPEHLIHEYDIYKKIAVALYPDAHRQCSFALLAKEFGAVARRGKGVNAAMRACKRIQRAPSCLRSSTSRVEDSRRRSEATPRFSQSK